MDGGAPPKRATLVAAESPRSVAPRIPDNDWGPPRNSAGRNVRPVRPMHVDIDDSQQHQSPQPSDRSGIPEHACSSQVLFEAGSSVFSAQTSSLACSGSTFSDATAARRHPAHMSGGGASSSAAAAARGKFASKGNSRVSTMTAAETERSLALDQVRAVAAEALSNMALQYQENELRSEAGVAAWLQQEEEQLQQEAERRVRCDDAMAMLSSGQLQELLPAEFQQYMHGSSLRSTPRSSYRRSSAANVVAGLRQSHAASCGTDALHRAIHVGLSGDGQAVVHRPLPDQNAKHARPQSQTLHAAKHLQGAQSAAPSHVKHNPGHAKRSSPTKKASGVARLLLMLAARSLAMFKCGVQDM
uniref:Uncharacterized protein n=1 Tax=Chlamydomonas euryale TaxID=1486919 RepID=A0A7R9YTC3_9CHLO|mmetsp:Transcript_18448/g.55071  ORF Transcript_18448/g.55071 Transcript_18448/m.55071 type:complete len:358 (+) Transcript_18448:444-1517(+)